MLPTLVIPALLLSLLLANASHTFFNKLKLTSKHKHVKTFLGLSHVDLTALIFQGRHWNEVGAGLEARHEVR